MDVSGHIMAATGDVLENQIKLRTCKLVVSIKSWRLKFKQCLNYW